jgi:uncharacterized repeat protein (TIGR01451 family)
MHSPTATITPIITITPEATITPVDTRIPAKLEITMQVIDTTVSAGNYVEVRIKIKNIGEVVAQNILLQQIIPFMTIFDQDYLDNKYWIYKGKSIQRNIGNLHDGEIINIQPAGAEFNMYQDSPFPRTVVYSNSGSFAIGAIIVYPNILDLKKGGAVKFINLPKDTKVIIYTISGEVVQEYRNISSIVLWNGKNINERIVSPGFYYYVISWEKGKKKKTGKIFVID